MKYNSKLTVRRRLKMSGCMAILMMMGATSGFTIPSSPTSIQKNPIQQERSGVSFMPSSLSTSGKKNGRMNRMELNGWWNGVASSSSVSTATTSSNMVLASLDNAAGLKQYFLETCISVGVPAAIWTIGLVIVIKTIAGSSRSNNKDSEFIRQQQQEQDELLNDLLLNDNKQQGQGGQWWSSFVDRNNNNNNRMGGASKLPNYFKITPLHNMYQNYNYTMTSATTSRTLAQYQYQTSRFQQALERIQPPITASEWKELVMEEEEYCKVAYPLQKEITQTSRLLQQTTLANNNHMNNNSTSGNLLTKLMPGGGKKNATDTKLFNQYINLQKRMVQLDLEFQSAVLEILGTTEERMEALQLLATTALPGNVLGRRPLDRLFGTNSDDDGDDSTTDEKKKKKNVYVLDFNGDVTASQVDNLREEVSSILLLPTDHTDVEVVVKLSSPGGTVTGYGLAAAQLTRFRQRGIPLTICVEQVAASGGYMMACVADKIVASPLAVLGSIGVISDQPNFYQRLKQEGIEFQTVTAGKYKRTLTPTKKVTKEDLEKSKEELEGVLLLFKDFVHQNRPSLDIDKVATGETWFGEDALKQGLCDAIATYDDTIANYILEQNANVYKIEYTPPNGNANPLLAALPGSSSNSNNNMNSRNPVRNMIRSVAQMVREEIMSEASIMASSSSNRYSDLSKSTMARMDDNEFYF